MVVSDLDKILNKIEEGLSRLLEEEKPESGQKCGCSDSGCSAHKDKPACTEEAKTILYRIDLDDEYGTAFCDKCAKDALDSGVYTNEKVKKEKSSGGLFSEGKDSQLQEERFDDYDDDEDIVESLDALDVKATERGNSTVEDMIEEALYDAGVDNWADYVKAVGIEVANGLYTDLNSVLKVFNEADSFPYSDAYQAVEEYIEGGDNVESAIRHTCKDFKVTKGSKESQKLLSYAKKAYDNFVGDYIRSHYSFT
jgi:hypothetical protein